MNLSEVLKKTCKDRGISVAELARRTHQTPQNLTMKLRRKTVGFEEFVECMEVLGVRVDFNLVYPDGESPELPIPDKRIQEKISILESALEVERRNAEYQKSLSTEIRTAIYSIEGYVEMGLKYRGEKRRMIESLERARKASVRLNQLFDYAISGNRNEHAEVEIGEVDMEKIRGKKILLVEDNELNREITKDILEENGLIVDCAGDGLAAIRKVQSEVPGFYDCVLMDIQMPDLDGLEAARRIRALPNRVRAGVPIIAMTANAFEEDRKKTLEAGMDAQLIKPMDAEKMVKTISQFL